MAPNQSNSTNSLTTASSPESLDDEPPNNCQNGLIDDQSIFNEDVLLIEDLEAGNVPGSKSDLNSKNSTTTDRFRKPKLIRRTTTHSLISSPRSRPSNKCKDWSQLFVYAFAELVGGFTFSLLSPFYTKEATAKGLSVSETGLVRYFEHISLNLSSVIATLRHLNLTSLLESNTQFNPFS